MFTSLRRYFRGSVLLAVVLVLLAYFSTIIRVEAAAVLSEGEKPTSNNIMVLQQTTTATTTASSGISSLISQVHSSSSSSSPSMIANELLKGRSRRIDQYHDEDSFENRVLGQNNQQYYYNNGQGSWLDDYSLKFLGCDASSNYARFRLCPLGACWNKDRMGCRKNYGDYAVDMQSYVEAMMTLWDGVAFHACNRTAYEECSTCFTTNFYNDEDEDDYNYNAANAAAGDDYYYGNDDYTSSGYTYDDDGGFNATGYESKDECLYDCLHNSAMPSCYYVLTEDDYFMERYGCGRLDGTDYYLGPYCGEDGSGIYIGLFQDDECRRMVNDGSAGGVDTWKSVADDEVAFTETSKKSLQFKYCLRCENLYMDERRNSGDSNEDQEEDDFDGTACDLLYQDESLLGCEVKMASDAKQYGQTDDNVDAEVEFYDDCYEIDSIPLPKKWGDNHSPFYTFAIPILIALGLLILSQRRNHFDRDQFIDKKESLVGVHGAQDLPLQPVQEDSSQHFEPPRPQGYTGVLS